MNNNDKCKCGNVATLYKIVNRVDEFDAKWTETMYYCVKCNPDKEVEDD